MITPSYVHDEPWSRIIINWAFLTMIMIIPLSSIITRDYRPIIDHHWPWLPIKSPIDYAQNFLIALITHELQNYIDHDY